MSSHKNVNYFAGHVGAYAGPTVNPNAENKN
jgi:hypothetical protein